MAFHFSGDLGYVCSMQLRVCPRLMLAVLLLGSPVLRGEEPATASIPSAIAALATLNRGLQDVPFAGVIHAATGRRVLPFTLTNDVERTLLTKITGALDAVLAELNQPSHIAHQERRINEVSAHFEDALRAALNRVPGFACEVPKTAAGKHQRAGYPDLRLEDQTSRRVLYLDVKLVEQSNRDSTLRTFYFEPKQQTGKVLEDAHHLLVGFEHAGRMDGRWKYLNWNLVDLSRFHLRLKAEFQGSNRDLYRPDTLVGSSRK